MNPIVTSLRAGILGLLALTALACAAAPVGATGAAAADPTSAPTIRSFTAPAAGFHTRSYTIETDRGVVVVGAQFTVPLAKALLTDLRSHTQAPITHVVVTHPNPDKFNGATVFQKQGAKLVASAKTAAAIPGVHAYKRAYFVEYAKMFTSETYPKQAHVDLTFSGSLSLHGGAVRLHELDHAGVSTTQTVVHVPAANALFVGDLVHHRAHAWLEGGIVSGKPTPDLTSWKLALAELTEGFTGTTVYGGRGEAAPVAQAVAAQTAYLDGMSALVSEYISGLDSAGKQELRGTEAAKHYKAIAERAAKRFPDNAHPYLVQYGVYGLVAKLM